FVIVSADGRLTDADHRQPNALRNKADHRFFVAGLKRADVVIHGRNSGDSDPKARARHRVIVTRGVATVARHPDIPNAALWNPAHAPVEDAAALIGVTQGMAAVIGGPAVFALFFGRYEVFWLSRAARV
ncbi:dihydrofolate reductase, partial [Aduncisulcus paluster]